MTQERPDAADEGSNEDSRGHSSDDSTAAAGRPTDEQSVQQSSDQQDGQDGQDGQDDEPDFSTMPIEEVPDPEVPDVPDYGEDESQGYVDRDKIDFDPDKGLYSGTLVHGGDSELPDPPSEKQVNAALEDIKAGGDGLVDEDGNKIKNRQDAED